jgi:carbon-monoxide dehydrogenase medium subunit
MGPAGQRVIPIADFFLGPGKSALSAGELVTEIILPAPASPWRGQYLRLARRKGMDLATVGVLVARTDENGHSRHRVALAAVAPTPIRVREAEELLDREGIAASAGRAAAIAAAASCPITDLRGTAEYRREMVGVLVRRGLVGLS